MVDAGAALELLHTFALVHDDVMDGSATRRGTDTIHVRFDAGHALDGWRGEARRFGEGVAILVGDLAFVYADQLLAGGPAGRPRGVHRAAHRGERRPVPRPAGHRPRRRRPRRRPGASRRFKSGKYTVERPLHLGAALAGRLDELAGAAVAPTACPWARPSSCATTCWASSATQAVTGKPVGEDLREGKPTAALRHGRRSGRRPAGAAVLAR